MSMEPGPELPDVDADGFSDQQLISIIDGADGIEARNHANRLLFIARLARRRRRSMVSGRGGPGVDSLALADAVTAEVAEDFVAELALTRDCTEAEAHGVLREALLLTGPLAPTWSRLFAGDIGVRHARAAVDLLGDASPEVAAAVQARVLPRSEGLTATAFRDRLRYALYRVDAAAKERRRREALRRVGVFVRRFDEGVSELVVQGPTPAVHAAASAIDQYAQLRRGDGDERPIGVLRAETALDLVLRPWDTSRPPVTARLVLHAPTAGLHPDGTTPALLDGQVISAADCRDLLDGLDRIDLLLALDHPAAGQTLAVATRNELASAAPGAGLSPPPETTSYTPTARQKRYLEVRDRHCRMPGCRRRPGRVDLDHVQPHAEGGPTACENLCCLCRRHHRIKTHAPGWSFRLLPDGTLEVRTPAGITRTTRPPGWWPDPEPDPPEADDEAPPDPARS